MEAAFETLPAVFTTNPAGRGPDNATATGTVTKAVGSLAGLSAHFSDRLWEKVTVTVMGAANEGMRICITLAIVPGEFESAP